MLALLFLTACARQDSYAITFGGDIMLARDGAPIVKNWQAIDLSLPDEVATSGKNEFYAAALESPLTRSALSPADLANPEMNLCAAAQETSILTQAGLNIVTFDNNHKSDCSANGIILTQQLLAEAGFPLFEERNGIWVSTNSESNLAIISMEDVSSPVNEKAVVDVIRDFKTSGHFVVVSIHWGNEYQAGPDERQQTLAQTWVDAGADIIWGHHPHVLQRIDWLTSTMDGHTALVMYSLGNLMADQFMLKDAQHSALIRVEIKGSQIKKVTVIPVVFDWDYLSLEFKPEAETTARIVERLGVKPFKSVKIDVFSSGN